MSDKKAVNQSLKFSREQNKRSRRILDLLDLPGLIVNPPQLLSLLAVPKTKDSNQCTLPDALGTTATAPTRTTNTPKKEDRYQPANQQRNARSMRPKELRMTRAARRGSLSLALLPRSPGDTAVSAKQNAGPRRDEAIAELILQTETSLVSNAIEQRTTRVVRPSRSHYGRSELFCG
jgi:hypothetical protein